MNIQEKHEKLLYPAVRVRTEKAGGSGTVIFSDVVPGTDNEYESYVLTNNHVIADNIEVGKKWSTLLQREVQGDVLSECSVEFFDWEYESWEGGTRMVKADIMCYDKDMDLGLLKLKSSKKCNFVAELLPKDKHKQMLRRFQKVYAVGCGMGHAPIHTIGHLNGFDDVIDNYPYILSSAPTIFGNSGGSLYMVEDGKAYFVGVPSRITVAMLGFAADAITHMSYAIPVWTVYKFLEDQMFNFIYDPSLNSKQCAEMRKDKREQDERTMAIRMSRDSSEGETPNPVTPG